MGRYPKPPEGSWTRHYPHLGTGPVSYEDSTSPEFYELEREAIFKRAWLQVGRVEQLPQNGSYFTKEIKVVGTSIILMRDGDDVRAFHNICRHRGNKLVWTDFPAEDTSGTCRQFTCKYHGWRYGLNGVCAFVQQENEFFDLDQADFGLVPVHCDVWAGFIFVNFSPEPSQSLREYLGPMVLGIESYPFAQMTDRYVFRVECQSNWKIYADSLLEFYHAPVLHMGQHPSALRPRVNEMGFEGPYYQLEGPHGLLTTAGSIHRGAEMPPDMLKPVDRVTRSGLFGPWEKTEIDRLPPGINPGNINPWGLTEFHCFPNLEIVTWEAGWYSVYQFWPTSVNSVVFDGYLCWLPAKSASERVGREMAAVAFKEYALQDANTLEATQTALKAGVVDGFPLNDQEVLVRHLHQTAADWVEAYRLKG